jgi:salicylate hydroxylase
MVIARRTSIAIIGGGIGGLTAAAALLRAGFDVQVYERARALGEVGAGINIGPNASRILHRLGISEALGRTGVKPVTFDQRRWDDGRFLLRSPLGEAVESAFGAPYYTFHRGDLHRALADAIPSDHIHLAHRFTHLVDHGDRVEAHFDNGTSILADALIGADGIHSAVRHAVFGPEKPRFTGCVAHRALVPSDRLTHLGLELTTQIWMGPGRHFVHYFVSAGSLVNFVAITEEDSWLRESWVDRGKVADVLAAFRGWHNQVLSTIGRHRFQQGLQVGNANDGHAAAEDLRRERGSDKRSKAAVGTQALYDQIVEEKPDAGKEEIRALFVAVAMDDREMLQAIVNEIFEMTWTRPLRGNASGSGVTTIGLMGSVGR